MSSRVVVVGAGVIGLSAAVRLLEDPQRRFAVEIVAERIGERSLSSVAAASFHPYAVAHPHLKQWVDVSRARFEALLDDAAAGVRRVPGAELFRSEAAVDAARASRPEDAEALRATPEFAARDYVAGWTAPTIVIEMPLYLRWLRERFTRLGGTLTQAKLASLDEVSERGTQVVHATGLGARALCGDRELVPALGQIVRVAKNGMDEFRLDETDPRRPAYIVPRSTDCALGSIDVPWDVDARGTEPPPPDANEAAAIVERCARLDSRVRGAEILESYCGFRPRRPTVRLERDATSRAAGRSCIHDYGHGGAGVTLSWGCAEEVFRLVTQQ